MPTPERRERAKTSLLGGKPIPAESEEALAALKGNAWEKFEERAAKTLQQKRKREEAKEETSKKPKKEHGNITRWAGKAAPVPVAENPNPGCALVHAVGTRPAAILEKLGFRVIGLGSDPGAGVGRFVQEARKLSNLRTVTHLVLCKTLVSENIGLLGAAARLTGSFMCEETALGKLPPGGPVGVQFITNIKKPRQVFVHEAVERSIPGLRALLEAAADCPGSGLKVSPNYKKLQKAYVAYREKRGAKSKPWLQARAAMPPEVVKMQHKDYPWLCSEAEQFLEFLQEDIDRKAICPGYW